MKKSFLVIIIASIALMTTAVSCKKYESVPGDPMKSRIYTLDNGLKVYMTVNKEEPRIQTFIAVRSGGKNDPHETTGLAHYFEHLMFKGSEQFGTQDYATEKPMLDEIESLFETYRTLTDPAERTALYKKIDSVSYEASKIAIPNEYDKLMSLIGARGTNAWTSQDETVYTEDIPSNQIDNWAKIQADRFRHNVIRGFHTELETVYEEKNMSLTSDRSKLYEALQAGLFKKHPYGLQTVLGTQEQLKNPSITNIKNYYKSYYVPNNIAICVSGDFEPEEMLSAIKKYFGDWEPNPNLPKLQFEPEDPITEPVIMDVYGKEAEMLALGWRLPGSTNLKTTAIAEIASSILYNGQAGLMDVDINQQQKAMFMYAGNNSQPDYSMFLAISQPIQGQTLEQLRDLTLEEVEKLAAGDFDESLIASTAANIKLEKMRSLESNRKRANLFVDAFIADIPWKDYCKDIELYETITKDDVTAFAKEYLSKNSYALVYKRRGEDKNIQKIVAPKITAIETNRDKTSEFLSSIQASEVKPIEPVFVNFDKDMSRAELCSGVELLYKKNEINDIATVQFQWNKGKVEDPALETAIDYLEYLDTPQMSVAEFGAKLYSLATSVRFKANDHQSAVTISGLSENIPETIELVEHLITEALPDEDILGRLKEDLFKGREDAKKSQDACFNALWDYVFYGPEYIKASTMTNAQISALTPEVLLEKVRDLFAKGHTILYYGPLDCGQVQEMLASCHKTGNTPETLTEQFTQNVITPASKVVFAPYEANNFYYLQYSNKGDKFNRDIVADIDMYNNYFGSGMNAIVFQEMREARGLAYSANAYLSTPSFKEQNQTFYAYIASQSDKLQKAVEAFDSIINDMPESEQAFAIAKEGMLSRIRTKRTIGINVLTLYQSCVRRGLDEPIDKETYERLQSMTLEDVKATQQKWIAGRPYVYGILGDPVDIDFKFLNTLGPVEKVSLEQIFGY